LLPCDISLISATHITLSLLSTFRLWPRCCRLFSLWENSSQEVCPSMVYSRTVAARPLLGLRIVAMRLVLLWLGICSGTIFSARPLALVALSLSLWEKWSFLGWLGWLPFARAIRVVDMVSSARRDLLSCPAEISIEVQLYRFACERVYNQASLSCARVRINVAVECTLWLLLSVPFYSPTLLSGLWPFRRR
jgi:hypothetical protein